MFITDGSQNKMSYSNTQYDGLIKKAKQEGSDVKGRWNDLLKAEKSYLKMQQLHQYSNAVDLY